MYPRLTGHKVRFSTVRHLLIGLSFALLMALLAPSESLAFPKWKPACRQAADSFESRIFVFYAYTPGQRDPNAPKEIKERVEEINWALQSEAEHMTAPTLPLRFVMDCNQLGEPAIHEITTEGYPGQSVIVAGKAIKENAWGIEEDEWGYGKVYRALIFDNREGVHPGASGFSDRDKTASENTTNIGNGWAMSKVWNEPGGIITELHEVFHSLGAVNSLAPYYGEKGHCNDGRDIMCATKETFVRCSAPRWAEGMEILIDCGEDTYLDPIAEPGEWLAANYNIGEDSSFIIVPPAVTTNTATGILSARAVLKGTVNPRGEETRYYFQYGPTTSYGNSIPVASKSAGAGTSPVAVEETVTGLEGSTTYHYRLVAEKEDAAVYGEDRTFTTQPGGLPLVRTEPPAVMGDTSMTLTGVVNPNQFATDYYFEYGSTVSYGSKTPTVSLGSGSSPISIKTPIAVSPTTIYHYRLVASNKEGTVYGSDVEVKTCQAGGCQASLASTPNPTPVTKSALEQVSCGSVTECVAVGYDRYQGKSIVARWSGGAWTLTNSELEGKVADVSCVATRCYAVGMKEGKPVFWKLTEGKPETDPIFGFPVSRPLPLPAATTSSTIEAISCTGQETCTAVGSYHQEGVRKPLVARTNGNSNEWWLQSAPSPAGGSSADVMLAVSCSATASCVTVGTSAGKPTAHRWTGGEWSLITPNNPSGAVAATLESVSCTATGCMAVGNYLDSAGAKRSLAQSWNGTSWSTLATPAPAETPGDYELADVSCLSQTSCFAVGNRVSAMKENPFGSPFPEEGRTLVETWNGTSWSVQASPHPAGNKWSALTGVACSSSVSCRAVGGAYKTTMTGEGTTLAHSYNGSAWSLASTPNPTPVIKSALDQVSCGSTTECVAVGYDRYQGKSILARWSAGAWTLIGGELSGKVADVSCVETRCWAVGMNEGKPVSWKLTEGKPQTDPIFGFPVSEPLPLPAATTASAIESISCSAKEACTAVGYHQAEGSTKPLVARLGAGEQWTLQSAPSPEGGSSAGVMLAVSCPSATSCTTVGKSGGNKPTAHRWNGTTWSVIAPNNPSEATTATLEGVSCTATGCMAVGHYTDAAGKRRSLAQSWNGTSWSTLATPAPAETPGDYELSDVSCLSQSSCFAVGSRVSATKEVPFAPPVADEGRTLVEVWNGTSWSVQASPHPAGNKWSALTGIACPSSVSCRAVGGAYKTTMTGEGTTLAVGYE